MPFLSVIRKTWDYALRNGLKAAFYAVWEEAEKRKDQAFAYTYQAPGASALEAQRLQAFSMHEAFQTLKAADFSGKSLSPASSAMSPSPNFYETSK
ncbi:MAG: hypothetical protein IJU50_03855, partial [Lachnospiraceae bacterium]|nr:hypothetical protein [Lachnospiraceae bacterium]